MNYQGFEKRNLKILALIIATLMLLSVFSVFPVMAAGSSVAGETEIEIEDGGTAPIVLPDYIVYDHNYIADNLSTDKALNVTNPCWSHVATDHHAEEGFVRLKIDMGGTEATTNDPYIALELEKNEDGNGKYSLSDYNYITIVARYQRASAISARFELFYETDTSVNRWWSVANGPTNNRSTAYAEIDNWQVITFDLTKASGGIKSVRLDFLANGSFGEGDHVDIVAVVLNKDGQAAYDSSYEIMESLYNPVQILKDFAEEDVVHFSHGMNSTNTVSIKDGNVIYKSNYVEANVQSGKDPYMDPYAGFRYDNYINAKNAGLDENDPNRLQKLTPKDFRYVVLKTRTNPEISGGLQLFVYVNGNGANGDYSPNGIGSASTNYGWRSVYVDMNANSRNSFKDIWLAEGTVFNGFRVDWAGTGGPGYFCELDEIIFFKTAEDAKNFSVGLNSIPAPSDYDENLIPDEGETYVPTPAGDTYSVYSHTDLLIMNNTVENGAFSISRIDDIGVAALLSDGAGAPSVTFLPEGINANNYETLAFVVKATGTEDETFDLVFNYKTASMTAADQAHQLIAEDLKVGSWHIVSFDLSKVSDWSEEIEQIKLECVNESGEYEQGFGVYIQSAGLCFYPENAEEFAKYVSETINTPKQIISNLNGGDLGYFKQGVSATEVTISGGNLKYTATAESSDPYAFFRYKKFMKDSTKYKALTTEDFNYITIKYRAGNVKSNKSYIELFILDENYNPIVINPDSGGYASYVSKLVKYRADEEWHYVTIDMTDGGNNEAVWKDSFYGVRFDWCAATSVDPDSYFEISEMMFFATKEEAENYENMISSVIYVVGEDVEHLPEESETLPSFPDGGEDETETLPTFPGVDSTEETSSETLPEFPGSSEETSSENAEESSGVNTESTDNESQPDEDNNTERETLPQFSETEDNDTEAETPPQFSGEGDTNTEIETMPQFTVETDTDTEIETNPQFSIETDSESEGESRPDNSEAVGDNTENETTDSLTENDPISSETDDESNTEEGTEDESVSDEDVGSSSEASDESDTESSSEDESTDTSVTDTESDVEDDTDTGTDAEDDTGSDVETAPDTDTDTDIESGSEIETDTEPDTDTDTDADIESGGDTDTEIETETEEETEGKLPGGTDTPIKPDVNVDTDATETKGSQVPFLIACAVLALFSVSSIGIVIYIKIRMKYFS